MNITDDVIFDMIHLCMYHLCKSYIQNLILYLCIEVSAVINSKGGIGVGCDSQKWTLPYLYYF